MEAKFMAKKQYLSPELEINALCCEDVLTASTEIDGVRCVYGDFATGWINGTTSSNGIE